MTVQSMTGFGKGEVTTGDYSLLVEIKSVNNRFKDFRFKLPSTFSSKEIGLRKSIEKHFKRGSFEIYASYKTLNSESAFEDLDDKKIQSLIERIESISNGKNITLSPTDFLRSEFYQDKSEDKAEKLGGLLTQAFELACHDLALAREGEGEKLRTILLEHLAAYKKHFEIIPNKAKDYEKGVKEKLEKRISENHEELKIEPSRLLQEVVFYLEKLDIQEEISRINAHLEKVESLLGSGGQVGRQLDFMIQELNRETNTIGSKSGNNDISNAAVQMKVQLEKMREQALNME